MALWTFRDYAISNDEGVQHHYGELILDYYASGFKDHSVFNFENLYLYGGLFDIIAVGLAHLAPGRSLRTAPYPVRADRHRRDRRRPRRPRDRSRARAPACSRRSRSCVCGAWYGTMFNHTKDIPFAAAMMGATLFLIRIARRLPSPAAARYRRVRRAGGRRARHARARPDPDRLCCARDPIYLPARGERARAGPAALASGDRRVGAAAARLGARLSHHDPRVAVGGAGAAQSDPRPARLLRIPLQHPHHLRRPGLRHGGRAAAVCPGLHADPAADVDAVRRGGCDAVDAAAAPRRRLDAAAAPGYRLSLASR